MREYRARYNMTQENLAKRLKVSRQTIISLENERYNPSLILAIKIARAFRTEIENVFIYDEKEDKKF